MDLNRVFILGNLTRDPELRTIPSGQNVCNFSIATNRRWKDSNGQQQQDVEYHNIVVWGRLAEICGQYLAKGRLVFVEGRLQTRSWEDQQGNKRYRTEIVAQTMQMGPRGAQQGGGDGGDFVQSSAAPPPGQGFESQEGAPAEDIPTIDIDGEVDEINVKDIPF